MGAKEILDMLVKKAGFVLFRKRMGAKGILSEREDPEVLYYSGNAWMQREIFQ